MKAKILAAAILMVSASQAFAVDAVITPTDAALPTPKAVVVALGDLGGYVKKGFTFNPSRNVVLNSTGNNTWVGVQTANIKGRTTYGASSAGGIVGACGPATTGSTPPVVVTPPADGNGCI